jgi:hypothetical protein
MNVYPLVVAAIFQNSCPQGKVRIDENKVQTPPNMNAYALVEKTKSMTKY